MDSEKFEEGDIVCKDNELYPVQDCDFELFENNVVYGWSLEKIRRKKREALKRVDGLVGVHNVEKQFIEKILDEVFGKE
jgi:hypothetical protein